MDYLKFLMLFYLYHFLYIVNNIHKLINYNNCYNLNLFKSSSKNSHKLNIYTKISIDINIYILTLIDK